MNVEVYRLKKNEFLKRVNVPGKNTNDSCGKCCLERNSNEHCQESSQSASVIVCLVPNESKDRKYASRL